MPRGFPRVLAGGSARITEGSGRLQLADWLTRTDNPLTARVMVNRIWQHHFGEGLVRTPNDFGERGERPTHPELLDYLAARFVESGWSVKAMHRLIMLSSVYQQSSRTDADGSARDPDNRLFGRMNRQRLEAEAIRDSLLAVAGRLDARPGGPPFADLAVPRRTLYLMSVRTGPGQPPPTSAGCSIAPTPARSSPSAASPSSAPQALFFLNDPFVTDHSPRSGRTMVREEPRGDEAASGSCILVLGRPPTPAEIDVGLELLSAGGGRRPWKGIVICSSARTNSCTSIDTGLGRATRRNGRAV